MDRARRESEFPAYSCSKHRKTLLLREDPILSRRSIDEKSYCRGLFVQVSNNVQASKILVTNRVCTVRGSVQVKFRIKRFFDPTTNQSLFVLEFVRPEDRIPSSKRLPSHKPPKASLCTSVRCQKPEAYSS